MGFLDDSDSDSDLDGSCMNDMSTMSISLSFHATGAYHGRRSNVPAASNTPNTNADTKKAFKFSWDDSTGLSSVDTEDLEQSESSFSGILPNDRHERSKNPTDLGKLLEQVDGVGYQTCVAKKPNSCKPEEDSLAKVEPEQERVTTIRFVDPLVTDLLEYNQDKESVLRIWQEDHVAQVHNQVPWDEEDYEELPWHLVPDVDEDDVLTKRCKEVIPNPNRIEESDDCDDAYAEVEEDMDYCRRIDRVEAMVIEFVLRLKYKRLRSKVHQQQIGDVFVGTKPTKRISDQSCASTDDTSFDSSASSADGVDF